MSRPFRAVLVAAALLLLPALAAAGPKALFDNTHAETAGNADWIIDADQPLPLPDQSTVTQATPRTTWLGAISSWGIDLVKRGYFVATLTSAYGITYHNAGNPYDLSNYDVFILPEPNTRFTAAESTAIFNFVRDGGGLIAVSDHSGSDRNGDGFDSPQIFDLLDAQHLFGVHFGIAADANNNIVQDSGNIESALSDSIIHGPNGVADSVSYHNGTTLTLYPAVNPTVKGDIWMTGLAHGTTGLMAAHSVYGNGRVFFAGDSSPIDDGSAQSGNNNIFDGWGEVHGRDSLLFLNATMWAARRPPDTTPPTVTVTAPNGGETWVMGSTHDITWTAGDNVGVDSIDLDVSFQGAGGPWLPVAHGLTSPGTYSWTISQGSGDQVLIRITARDAAGNAGVDQSDGVFAVPDVTAVPPPGAPDLALAPPGPGPSRGEVSLRFTLPAAGLARVEILDVTGRRVRTLMNGRVPAGEQRLTWDGRGTGGERVGAGVYLVRLVSGSEQRVRRIVRL